MRNPTLKLHEQRFMVSPCGYYASYFHLDEIAAEASDWTDCTDMGDGELNDLMVRRMQVSSLEAA